MVKLSVLKSNMATMRNYILLISICISLLACGGRSLLTADLTNKAEFRALVGKELNLLPGDKAWILMRDPYDPLTSFSEGYKLSLISSEQAKAISSAQLEPPLTPNGFYEVVGIVDGSLIRIEKIHEYGMETAAPVALGRITLAGGQNYPFESEWWPNYSSQIFIKVTH